MKGTRLPDNTDWDSTWSPGQYCKYQNGKYWILCTPNNLVGMIDTTKHKVVEHEDKTITVSPSILIQRVGTSEGWHGYLENGVWRSC